MGLIRTVEPTTPVVTLYEAKDHLIVEHDDHDLMIESLVSAATTLAENYTERSFSTQTWKQTYDIFPAGIIKLERGPVQSVTSITYYDTGNVQQTIASEDYRVDTVEGRIEHVDDWPATYDRINAVEITYVTGEAEISDSIKSAIKLIVGHLYQNRQDVITGTQVNEIPQGSKYLLHQYRNYVAR